MVLMAWDAPDLLAKCLALGDRDERNDNGHDVSVAGDLGTASAPRVDSCSSVARGAHFGVERDPGLRQPTARTCTMTSVEL